MNIMDGEQVVDLAKALSAMAKEADMVCVVRCKDCKNYDNYTSWCDCNKTVMRADDFCSYGEMDGES